VTEEERLRAKIKKLQAEIGDKDSVLHGKNLALDALGYVWCSGGCKDGVFRYQGECKLTSQQVSIVERNTIRLREWYEASKCKNARATGAKMDKCDDCGYCCPHAIKVNIK